MWRPTFLLFVLGKLYPSYDAVGTIIFVNETAFPVASKLAIRNDTY